MSVERLLRRHQVCRHRAHTWRDRARTADPIDAGVRAPVLQAEISAIVGHALARDARTAIMRPDHGGGHGNAALDERASPRPDRIRGADLAHSRRRWIPVVRWTATYTDARTMGLDES